MNLKTEADRNWGYSSWDMFSLNLRFNKGNRASKGFFQAKMNMHHCEITRVAIIAYNCVTNR